MTTYLKWIRVNRFQKSYSYRKQSLNIYLTVMILVIDYGADLKDRMKWKSKKKNRSLAIHFIEIKRMMLSCTTKFWIHRHCTTETRLKESFHLSDTKQNEAMSNSIAKCAIKSKSYGMTILLTNRVIIAIGVSNLGAESFWKRVYSRLVTPMSPETTSFLRSQDKYRSYRSHRSVYAKKTKVKKKELTIETKI